MEQVINIQDINFAYGEKEILQHLNLSMVSGKVYAILGPNGAGKTTLINILLGRLAPQSGHVSILNQPPGSDDCRARVGAMMQTSSLPLNIKVNEFLKLFSSYYPQPLPITKLITLCQLEGVSEQTFDTLSGGEKQRLFMALALVGNPDIVILDEPSVGMDVESRQQLWQAILTLKQQNKTVLLTTHYLHEAEHLADELYVLQAGNCQPLADIPEFNSHYKRSEIRFCCDASAAAIVSALPLVEISHQQGKYIIMTDSPSQVLLQLLSHFSVSELVVSPPCLEQSYLSYMNARSA